MVDLLCHYLCASIKSPVQVALSGRSHLRMHGLWSNAMDTLHAMPHSNVDIFAVNFAVRVLVCDEMSRCRWLVSSR